MENDTEEHAGTSAATTNTSTTSVPIMSAVAAAETTSVASNAAETPQPTAASSSVAPTQVTVIRGASTTSDSTSEDPIAAAAASLPTMASQVQALMRTLVPVRVGSALGPEAVTGAGEGSERESGSAATKTDIDGIWKVSKHKRCDKYGRRAAMGFSVIHPLVHIYLAF